MRVFLLLLLALAVAAVLALYPEITQQNMHFEAFGWVAELNQAVFLLVLLLSLIVFWVMRKLLVTVLTLPVRLWRGLGSRSLQQRESRLRHGIARLIDRRHDLGSDDFEKADSALPDWALDLLKACTVPVQEQTLPPSGQDYLKTSLIARLVTRPESGMGTSLRREFLKGWLQASPEAPLAKERLLSLAEEEGDWPLATDCLEALWQHDRTEPVRIRLAGAYIGMAERQPAERINWLRKAHKLDSGSGPAVLALGLAYREAGDQVAARQLWNKYLKEYDDISVARSLLDLTEDHLRAYRRIENDHAQSMSASYQWFRAQLAYHSGLAGLATEHMQVLVKQHPGKLAWKSWGDWNASAGDWEQAARCYARALECGEAGG